MKHLLFILLVQVTTCSAVFPQSQALVFQSDFGVKDGAVAAMKGVAYGVSNDLDLFDLTHEIPAFNIWEAAYRLNQAAAYWPAGTVFVSVVDPGVGSERKSVVLKTKTGHFFVSPDNGTLTLVAESMGVEEVREIDEARNRLKNSGKSYTFHGRDVYAYTGAKLAAGIISFQEVGPVLTTDIVRLSYQKPVFGHRTILGTIEVLDVQYGNVWTNIDRGTFALMEMEPGSKLKVKIRNGDKLIFNDEVQVGNTFADVPSGKSVAYMNSLDRFSLGINLGSFADTYKVGSGPEWRIELSK
jgi:S-adenosylmethionine hydrolase